MRSFIQIACTCLALAGCLVATDDFSDGRNKGPVTAVPSGTADASVAKVGDPVDAGQPGPPPAYDWQGDVGPSHPELFVSMSGQAKAAPCPSSACFDFVSMDSACLYGLQAKNVHYEAMVSEADCAALKRWFTSDVLLAGLRSSCGGFTGEEEFEVQTSDPAYSVAKKFDGCTGEPFVTHRAVLAAVRAKYFPGK